MPNRSKYHLTSEQLKVIEQDLTSANPKLRRRVLALKLLHEGHGVTAVAHEVGVSRQTVYDWIAQSGIRDNPRQQALAFAQAIIEALEEKEWDFEELHTTLEQRLARNIEPLDLKVKLVLIRAHRPDLVRMALMG